jgi:hypothetical protein
MEEKKKNRSILFAVLGLIFSFFYFGIIFTVIALFKSRTEESRKRHSAVLVLAVLSFVVLAVMVGSAVMSTVRSHGVTQTVNSRQEEQVVQQSKKTKKTESSSKTKKLKRNKPLSFVLDASKPTESKYYGYLRFNQGTEFEANELYCRVPDGKYKVTNINNYPTQINIYRDQEKNTTEEGWEEWVIGDAGGSFLIDVDETMEIVVKEGYVIHLDPPSVLYFVKEK